MEGVRASPRDVARNRPPVDKTRQTRWGDSSCGAGKSASPSSAQNIVRGSRALGIESAPSVAQNPEASTRRGSSLRFSTHTFADCARLLRGARLRAEQDGSYSL